MARAAVRAKQAQAAQAQAAVKPSRKQRKHASGGNPNQDLFFTRLRRRQKWVFLALAAIFAVSFVALGVGSGNGSGLQDMFNSILGNGGNPVAQAQSEIKTNPAKGYMDLADAYITKNDLTNAIGALTTYVGLDKGKTDSNAWAQLGGYQKQQGDTAASQYQQVLQAAAIQSPGSIFAPTGPLASQLGTNPIDQYYSTKNQALSGPLYQKAIAAYNASLTDFQNAAKYAKGTTRADAWLAVYSAAQLVGNNKVALKSLQRYVALSPNSPNLKQIEAQCTKLHGSCVPAHK
jgi:hypothetical protein